MRKSLENAKRGDGVHCDDGFGALVRLIIPRLSLTSLIRIYTQLPQGRWQASARDPLRLDEHSEPEPDYILLKPSPDDYTNCHPRPDEVFLLIEVSDTTLDYDREDKLPAYGRAGIGEVWIVNLTKPTIEVYRDPHFTGYGSKTTLSSGNQIVPQAFPDAVAEVVELLKR